MAFIAEERRKKFWFGTEQRCEWFATPNRGADVSPTGWEAGGTLLNGGGYQLNSFGSHKNYIFEWPSSSAREVAQKMKSYADGTYGRGLIYFLDPLTWTTNMLPAQWADPSMALGYEGTSLVYGVDPVSVPTSGWEANDLPVNSAYYDLAGVAAGWRGKEQAVFIPIPTGYTLSLGSFHSQSGTGRVYYREQAKNGALGAITALTPLANNSSQVVNTFVSGPGLAGVWLYVGKTGSGAGSVTLTAMVGRLIETAKTVTTMVAQNLFTNPNLVGDGTWAEVRRNLCANPSFEAGSTGWAASSSSISVSSDYAKYGSHSLLVEPSANTGGARLSSVPTEVGVAYTFSYWAFAPIEKTLRGGFGPVNGTPVTVPANEWTRVSVSSVATGATTNFYASSVDSLQPFFVDGVQVEVGSAPTDYFDGDSPQGSIDPDMRQRWLGAENASESVMEIERVRGLTVTNCVAGVSAKDGKPAVRVIPTGLGEFGNDSYFQIPVPVVAQSSGTLVGTSIIPSPLTGSLFPEFPAPRYGGGLRTRVPNVYTGRVNSTGAEAVRLSFSDMTSAFQARWYHGGYQGSGDVWWTDIGLFAGDYDGPAFAGDSSGVVINGRNVRTQWDGAPDNSTSSAWTMTPEFDRLKEGPWIGGQGHSGCRFMGKPTYINNTGVDGGQVGFAASFREVGLWANG